MPIIINIIRQIYKFGISLRTVLGKKQKRFWEKVKTLNMGISLTYIDK